MIGKASATAAQRRRQARCQKLRGELASLSPEQYTKLRNAFWAVEDNLSTLCTALDVAETEELQAARWLVKSAHQHFEKLLLASVL